MTPLKNHIHLKTLQSFTEVVIEDGKVRGHYKTVDHIELIVLTKKF